MNSYHAEVAERRAYESHVDVTVSRRLELRSANANIRLQIGVVFCNFQ